MADDLPIYADLFAPKGHYVGNVEVTMEEDGTATLRFMRIDSVLENFLWHALKRGLEGPSFDVLVHEIGERRWLRDCHLERTAPIAITDELIEREYRAHYGDVEHIRRVA